MDPDLSHKSYLHSFGARKLLAQNVERDADRDITDETAFVHICSQAWSKFNKYRKSSKLDTPRMLGYVREKQKHLLGDKLNLIDTQTPFNCIIDDFSSPTTKQKDRSPEIECVEEKKKTKKLKVEQKSQQGQSDRKDKEQNKNNAHQLKLGKIAFLENRLKLKHYELEELMEEFASLSCDTADQASIDAAIEKFHLLVTSIMSIHDEIQALLINCPSKRTTCLQNKYRMLSISLINKSFSIFKGIISTK